jgi:SAM-dependent methyltransferase
MVPTFSTDGARAYSIWEHSATVRELYARRCRREVEEMTAHAQAVDLLVERAAAGDSVLDVGCGSGYFFHALERRGLDVSYWGIDASDTLLNIGRALLPAYGLPAERLITAHIDDLEGEVDHVVCINVLSNIDNFHRPLERLLKLARKSVILRESMRPGRESVYHYVHDKFLEASVPLNVHVNHYGTDLVLEFVRAYGFEPTLFLDRRTGGQPEMVIDVPHYWTFLAADRVATKDTA